MRAAATITALTIGLTTGGTVSAETAVEYSRISLCVGDSEVVRVAAGKVMTYTAMNPTTGLPNMDAEFVEASHNGVAASDDAGNPAWMEIRPNVDLMTGPAEELLQSSDAYVAAIEGSRVVLQARGEGTQNFSYFVTDSETGHTVKKIVKVLVKQCGTSSEVAGSDGAAMCQGELRDMTETTRVIRGADKMFTFLGESTGREMYGAHGAGRVVLKKTNPVHGEYLEKLRVSAEGEKGCGFADGSRLEAVEGNNAYVLQMCVGETWVAPSHQGIKTVTRQGVAVSVEKSVNSKSFALGGVVEGFGLVTVEYNHPDAAPMTIFTETVVCN